MTRHLLHDGWTMTPTAGPVPAALTREVPATVPGTVHTDLIAAGAIPDPYLDQNEASLQWIGESDFTYRVSFDHPATHQTQERIDLVADGLDTVATLTLNGVELGRTRNQHRSYRFDLRKAIVEGTNELTVTFASALRSAREAEERMGARPVVGNPLPYNAIRKMACNFGWDWGPVLITAGIWKPMSVHGWSVARIAGAVPQVTVDDEGRGRVKIAVDLERTSAAADLVLTATLTGTDGTTTKATTTTRTGRAVLELTLDRPELWWPRGYGDQPLYDLSVEVTHDGAEIDRWSRQVGFRTVEVRSVPDEHGTGFEFHVNGTFVFVKGANWIPDDCFLPRVSRASYAAGIADALDADMNLLRVWGGGIYESEDFYQLCDQTGVLVWQDFGFACAAYAEAAELWEEVEAEAREHVARLASHPSLVLWNGSNENVEGYYHWGWREQLGPDVDWGRGYYDDLLPRVVAEIDPTRAYLPSSPFNPEVYAEPRDPDHGPTHSWVVWGREDYRHYSDSIPRFVAEFGFQGPPNHSTLAAAVHDQPLASDSPGMLAHQKADDGNGKLTRGWAEHLPDPGTFDDWHFTTQLNQARAITYGIEHFRSHAPRTAGSVVWQLNDCWPVTSWAAVDGARRRKPLWYALRAVNAAHLLMIQPRQGSLAILAGNDTDQPWTAEVDVRRTALDGGVLAHQRVALAVPPRSNQTVSLTDSVVAVGDPTAEVIVADTDTARRAVHYFTEDLHLSLPDAEISADVRPADGGYLVELTAHVFIKDLVLNADRLDPDATVDDMFHTLLPGETCQIHLRTTADLDPDAIRSQPALRCVNQLLTAARRPSSRGAA